MKHYKLWLSLKKKWSISWAKRERKKLPIKSFDVREDPNTFQKKKLVED